MAIPAPRYFRIRFKSWFRPTVTVSADRHQLDGRFLVFANYGMNLDYRATHIFAEDEVSSVIEVTGGSNGQATS